MRDAPSASSIAHGRHTEKHCCEYEKQSCEAVEML